MSVWMCVRIDFGPELVHLFLCVADLHGRHLISAPLVVGNPLPNPSVPSFFSVPDERILSTASEKSIAPADMFSFRFGPIIARLPYSVEKSTSHEKPSDLATRSTHLSRPILQPSPQPTRSCPLNQRPMEPHRDPAIQSAHLGPDHSPGKNLATIANLPTTFFYFILFFKIMPLSEYSLRLSQQQHLLRGPRFDWDQRQEQSHLSPGAVGSRRGLEQALSRCTLQLVFAAACSVGDDVIVGVRCGLEFWGEIRKSVSKKKEPPAAGAGNGNSEGRKCLHCVTEKTPQWRTGPMGPKTLCTAYGVGYKSDQLVSEYCPAASPTFILAKHSKSHRKVLKLW
ncbi:hypothetical protein ACLOJK_026394 [Asimina triloba]